MGIFYIIMCLYPSFQPSQVVQGFQTLTVTETKKKLALPQEYMEVAWEVAANDGESGRLCVWAVVTVCVQVRRC